MKNLVLVGMPCAGKTTLGRQLAERLQRPFYDSDICLEQQEGMTISQLCVERGIAYFREKEQEWIQGISQQEGCVISTGGGVVLQEENMVALEQKGVIIFLHRTPEAILSSGFSTEGRPLLQSREALYRLYQERLPLYQHFAHYCADNQGSVADCCDRLYEIAQTVSQPHRFCLIGAPVEHSLSPLIHNVVLETLCDRASYDLQHLEPEALPQWVQNIEETEIHGFNITMPHKQKIVKYLDQQEDIVSVYGCANTVVCGKGRKIGYNTDVEGFYLALADTGMEVTGKKLLFLGGGSVAKALAMGACLRGAESVTMLVRQPEKWKQEWEIPKGISIDQFSDSKIRHFARESHLLVQCTPLGMQGMAEDYQDFSFLDSLPTQSMVVDLIYAPRKTQLLQEAETRGHAVQNGLGMLIYQALLAEKYYLNADFNCKRMYQKVVKRLTAK